MIQILIQTVKNEIEILSQIRIKSNYRILDWIEVSPFILIPWDLESVNAIPTLVISSSGYMLHNTFFCIFQVYSDLEVAFVISEEEAMFKALCKTVELLQGNSSIISQYYYGCLFHELLAFQLADRHSLAEVSLY